jgi:hypothetical protein
MAQQTNLLPAVGELELAIKALKPALTRLVKATKGLDPKRVPVGRLADLLYDLRSVGRCFNSITAPFDDVVGPAIKAIEEHFIDSLAVGESSGVQGLAARVQITTSAVPVVEDWDKFYKHIRKTEEFDLLNRAVNREAVKERWEQKKRIPGVGTFNAKKVSCTKLNGKGK